jgi:hypothetical protein
MARKLHRQLGIRLDYDEIEKLFFGASMTPPSTSPARSRISIQGLAPAPAYNYGLRLHFPIPDSQFVIHES